MDYRTQTDSSKYQHGDFNLHGFTRISLMPGLTHPASCWLSSLVMLHNSDEKSATIPEFDWRTNGHSEAEVVNDHTLN
jgi:hypothetical protein